LRKQNRYQQNGATGPLLITPIANAITCSSIQMMLITLRTFTADQKRPAEARQTPPGDDDFDRMFQNRILRHFRWPTR